MPTNIITVLLMHVVSTSLFLLVPHCAAARLRDVSPVDVTTADGSDSFRLPPNIRVLDWNRLKNCLIKCPSLKGLRTLAQVCSVVTSYNNTSN